MKELKIHLLLLLILLTSTAAWADDVDVDYFKYTLDVSTRTATLSNYSTNYRGELHSWGCPSSITLPNTVSYNDNDYTVTSITLCLDGMFSSIVLPESVTSIKPTGFLASCSNLQTVTMPLSLTSIPDSFCASNAGSSSLQTVIFPGATPPVTVGSGVFLNASSVTIVVPASAVSAYQTAFSSYSSIVTVQASSSGGGSGDSGSGSGSGSGETSTETINDGSSTIDKAPVYGEYVDGESDCYFVIPSSSLNGIPSGSTISAMKFYSTSSSVSWGLAEFDVYLNEVDYSTVGFEQYYGPSFSKGTKVYAGSLSIDSNGEMTVEFDSDFTYHGGNLQVGFDQTTSGTAENVSFSGVSSANSCGIYIYNHTVDGNPVGGSSLLSYLPKVTFTYTGGSGSGSGSGSEPVDLGNYVSGDFTYSLYTVGSSSYCAKVIGTTITSGTMVIPSSVDYGGHTYSVVGIAGSDEITGSTGFSQNATGITGVTLPSSLETIGKDAFSGCTGLTSLTIPAGVTSIENGAFQSCGNLTSVTFEGSTPPTFWDATSASTSAFATAATTTLYVPSSYVNAYTSEYTSWSGAISGRITVRIEGFWYDLYTDSPNTATVVGYTSENQYNQNPSYLTVPQTVTYNGQTYTVTAIGDDAFTPTSEGGTYTLVGFRNNLVTLNLPSTITYIGDRAFNGFTRLLFFELPTSLTHIGDEAFKNCSFIQYFNIPAGVTYIGSDAFLGCSSVKDLVFQGANPPQWADGTVGNEFRGAGSAYTRVGVPGESCANNAAAAYASAYTAWAEYMENGVKAVFLNLTVEPFNLYGTPTEDREFIVYRLYCDNTAEASYIFEITPSSHPNYSDFRNTHYENCDFEVRSSVTYNDEQYTVTRLGDDFLYFAKINRLTLPSTIRYIGRDAITYRIGPDPHNSYNTIVKPNAWHIFMKGDATTQVPDWYDLQQGTPYQINTCGWASLDAESGEVGTTIKLFVPNQNFVNAWDHGCKDYTHSLHSSYSTAVNLGQEGTSNFPYYLTGVSDPLSYCTYKDRSWVVEDPVSDVKLPFTDRNYSMLWFAHTHGEAITELIKYDQWIGDFLYTLDEATGNATIVGMYPDDTQATHANLTPSNAVNYHGRLHETYADLTLPSSVTYNGRAYTVTGVGDHALSGEGLTGTLTIPASITNFGVSCFAKNYISEVVFEGNFTTISDGMFAYCSDMTSINIPSTVTSVGMLAFYQCREVNNITLSENVTELGAGAFWHCEKLSTIDHVPTGVIKLKNKVFAETSITTMNIHSRVGEIGSAAFFNCDKLKYVNIEEGCTLIGHHAFSGNADLAHINIPASVDSIGYGFLYGDTTITSLVIPASISVISDDKFLGGCKSLRNVYLFGEPSMLLGNNGVGTAEAYRLTKFPASDTNHAVHDYFVNLKWVRNKYYKDGTPSMSDLESEARKYHVNNCLFWVISEEMYNQYIDPNYGSNHEYYNESLGTTIIPDNTVWKKVDAGNDYNTTGNEHFPDGFKNRYNYPIPHERELTANKWATVTFPFGSNPDYQEYLKEICGDEFSNTNPRGTVIGKYVKAERANPEDGDDNCFYTITFHAIPFNQIKSDSTYVIRPAKACNIQFVPDAELIENRNWNSDNFQMTRERWTPLHHYVSNECDNEPGTYVEMVGNYVAKWYLRQGEFFTSNTFKMDEDWGDDGEKGAWSLTYYKVGRDGANYVDQYRCYFRIVKNGQIVSNARMGYLDVGAFTETTGITEISGSTGNEKSFPKGIYNLQGQRMNGDLKSLPAGVYIVNGKKIYTK